MSVTCNKYKIMANSSAIGTMVSAKKTSFRYAYLASRKQSLNQRAK